MAIPGELRQLVDHHCSCWHVDAKGKCLCCKNDPNESLDETLFDGLFKGRNETSMMAGDTSFEGIKPSAIVEYSEILICEFLDMRLCNLSDSSAFLGCREAKTCTRARGHSFVATVAAEHKKDCWEHRSFCEEFDHLNSSRRRVSAPTASGAITWVDVVLVTSPIRLAIIKGRNQSETVVKTIGDEIPVIKFNWPFRFDDNFSRTPDRSDPLPQLIRIRHSCRQAHQPNIFG
ncbi:unannotated protein [freshwater metagenome]|uniref:Unannotated protein n=1 Tax=freshwater metagenome TaxID=449393 RepID=A0A6J6EZD0_9ZZZZ